MGSKVTIYSTSMCASCKMVKKFFSIKGVEFEEVNLDEYPERREEAFHTSGALTVPIVVIERDNKQNVVVGYNLAKLAPALAV